MNNEWRNKFDPLNVLIEAFLTYQLQFVLNAAVHVACYRLSISLHVPLSGHDDVTLYE